MRLSLSLSRHRESNKNQQETMVRYGFTPTAYHRALQHTGERRRFAFASVSMNSHRVMDLNPAIAMMRKTMLDAPASTTRIRHRIHNAHEALALSVPEDLQ